MTVTTAVVLAAGEGTRLRPLTHNRPKPMLPAATRPILEHVLDALVDAGMDRLVLVVGYRRRRVQEKFGPDYRDVPIEYIEQSKQLGSGHALVQARDSVSGPVLVVNGDHLVEASAVREVADAFAADEPAATMAVIERDDPSRYGAVTLSDGQVTDIIEKPDTDDYQLINAGIYGFDEAIFERIEATPRRDGELALTDTIARLVERQRVDAVRVSGLWVDATYPWDLLTVARSVLDRGRVSGPERSAGVWVAETAQVHEEAVLRPPVAVAPDAEVGPETVLGPAVAVGRNVTIGANTTVVRSVLDSDTRVGHGATLVDTVCGQSVVVGVDVSVPGGPADVRVDERVFTDRRLGAVLADRAHIGGAATLEPGTLVGPDATVETGVTVDGQVPENGRVVR
ncbi:MAG: nucleoside-diphosphate-sugar pyrophosphorylase [halophilic archaeon J07HX64]|jgi:Nucleoside-diphosphate-sugar pyrophosphorylase involved in lipopolysaccharide biosynthesis/translation initiation factor 2B, gamma/epsilon subunits (eIF-2Bgamma/eIF-2Bepsilon)|nr:MAG: nucleoside-diphosphate-sugar pyrophosphorylase [halophilic archaeon J07HX64]